ncbi:MAG: hypothetical protein QXY40_09060, partial [Candidatus Methanomethylicia archaeon]
DSKAVLEDDRLYYRVYMKIRRLIASWEGENLVKTSRVNGLIWVLPCVDLMDLSISKRVWA